MYLIKNIKELETLDFSNLDQTKDSVRKSINGKKFIVSGDDIVGLTIDEVLSVISTSEWCVTDEF